MPASVESVGAPTEVEKVTIAGRRGELDELRVVDAVATHERDVEAVALHLLREGTRLRVLTAVVDSLWGGRLDGCDDGAVVLRGVVRVDRLGGDDLAATLGELGREGLDEAWPWAFLSWTVATFLMPAPERYWAANGPWTASVVQVRK